MADLLDLERRVIALEAASQENTKTLNWVVGTLGRLAADVSMVKEDVKALRSDTDELKADMREVKADIKGLRRDLPAMMAETMREVLREHKGS